MGKPEKTAKYESLTGPDKSGFTNPLHPAVTTPINKKAMILIMMNHRLIGRMQLAAIVSILTAQRIAILTTCFSGSLYYLWLTI
ncbi:hypothetical protein CF149_05309 [Pseudomonas psychrophila]|nr:hypothetical protein CF149_05309 [Pseudomonas psychrophila]